MTFSFSLEQAFLSQTIFVFLAAFTRLGSMVMVLPAFGATTVPPRIRLFIALALTAVVTPLIVSGFPLLPSTALSLGGFIIVEAILGLAIGLIVRLVMSSVQVAGTLIAFQSGLAFAQNFDPTQGVQGALIGTFLSVIAVTFIFVTDLHHLMIGALYTSFETFPPGGTLLVERFTQLALDTVASSFVLGVQLAAPFLAVGLVFYLGIGVLSKLMPQVQIFFIAMPANILLGFLILFLVLSTMMIWFSNHFEIVLSNFSM